MFKSNVATKLLGASTLAAHATPISPLPPQPSLPLDPQQSSELFSLCLLAFHPESRMINSTPSRRNPCSASESPLSPWLEEKYWWTAAAVFYYGFTRPSHDELKAEREESGKAKVLTVDPYTKRHVLISNWCRREWDSSCHNIQFWFIESITEEERKKNIFFVFSKTRRVNLPMSMLATTKKHFIPLVFPSVMSLSFVKLSENQARTWLIARRDDAAARGDEETQPRSAMCTAHCRRLANECDHRINVVGFESMTCNLAGWLHASPRWCVRKCFRRKKSTRTGNAKTAIGWTLQANGLKISFRDEIWTLCTHKTRIFIAGPLDSVESWHRSRVVNLRETERL